MTAKMEDRPQTHGWVPVDDFGTRLLLARRQAGLSVVQAAKVCGVHYATWSTWERGSMPTNLIDVVRKVATGLGVDRDWLMWGGPLADRPGPSHPKCAVRDSNPEPAGSAPGERWWTHRDRGIAWLVPAPVDPGACSLAVDDAAPRLIGRLDGRPHARWLGHPKGGFNARAVAA